MTPFDRSRFDWYPAGLCSPAVVCGSSGTPRPPLAVPLDTFVVHYGGAGSWLDPGDTATELAAVELYHARPNGKPNEYNSASDSEAVTWEYAGPFLAAHSSGHSSTSWGHLVLLGLEPLVEPVVSRVIDGIRRARRQAVAAGYLTADHAVVPHSAQRPTGCPGPLYTVPDYWQRIAAPLLESVTPMDTYILTPPNPSAEPGSPWVYISGPSMRPAFGRDVTPRPDYTPPPVVACPANRDHEYRNALRSLGL
jgi:hypothetical protein